MKESFVISSRLWGGGRDTSTPGLKGKNKGGPMGWPLRTDPSCPAHPEWHPNHIGALNSLAHSVRGFAVAVHGGPGKEGVKLSDAGWKSQLRTCAK